MGHLFCAAADVALERLRDLGVRLRPTIGWDAGGGSFIVWSHRRMAFPISSAACTLPRQLVRYLRCFSLYALWTQTTRS